MSQWQESRLLEMPVENAFDLVADVEAYPEFLPLWQRAEVVERWADGYETMQTVGVGLLAQRFRTRTSLRRPRRIVVESGDSLFRGLLLRWRFRPDGCDRCRVDFYLNCELAPWWLKPMVDAMMTSTARSMIEAFEARGKAVGTAGCRAPRVDAVPAGR